VSLANHDIPSICLIVYLLYFVVKYWPILVCYAVVGGSVDIDISGGFTL